jgi:phosphoglucosamine mutase
MAKLFGTDGVRGVANLELDSILAFKIGQAVGFVLSEGKSARPLVLIGKDTRISSDMLECALSAGLCSVGADVTLLGVIPTPGVAFATSTTGADAGVVISASHNPYEYNGIKIFGSKGYKLDDSMEERIEQLVEDGGVPLAGHSGLGRVKRGDELIDAYINHITKVIDGPLEGLRILVDCANGAASRTAPSVFESVGAGADFICTDPDGVNVNDNCGSTHLDLLADKVIAGGYDAGVAFDGDADRCLIIDEKGGLIDGDKILGACALDMKNRGKLRGNALVGTVMTNLGLHRFAKDNGFDLVTTGVGDRYVLEEMVKSGYAIGGEQSGHIIFLRYATTGDGQVTALKYLYLMKRTGQSASEIAAAVPDYPQKLINVSVPNDFKPHLPKAEGVSLEIKSQEEILGDEGRVLVRCSGTEPLIRVMVEGRDIEKVTEAAEKIADAVKTGAMDFESSNFKYKV